MTAIMAGVSGLAYPSTMHADARAALDRLTELQQAVETRTNDAGVTPEDVLEVGAAVLAFAEREESALFPLLPLLDPAAREELGGEHAQLAEDLQLLRWLVATTPDSPDVDTLARALVRRMRSHVARDGRLLAQAVRMASG